MLLVRLEEPDPLGELSHNEAEAVVVRACESHHVAVVRADRVVLEEGPSYVR